MTPLQLAAVIVVAFFVGYFLGRAQVAAAWNLAEEEAAREQQRQRVRALWPLDEDEHG